MGKNPRILLLFLRLRPSRDRSLIIQKHTYFCIVRLVIRENMASNM